jgi:hypothetical protein
MDQRLIVLMYNRWCWYRRATGSSPWIVTLECHRYTHIFICLFHICIRFRFICKHFRTLYLTVHTLTKKCYDMATLMYCNKEIIITRELLYILDDLCSIQTGRKICFWDLKKKKRTKVHATIHTLFCIYEAKKKNFSLERVTNTKLLDFYFPAVAGKFKYTFVPCRAMLSLTQCVCGFDAALSNDRYELYAVTKCMSIVFIQRLEECWHTWWNRTKTKVSGKNLETLLTLGKNTGAFT